MLFAVRMDVAIPTDMDPTQKADLLTREKAYSQELQRAGEWPHIWRCVGEYANLSIFDVEDNTQAARHPVEPAALRVHEDPDHAACAAPLRHRSGLVIEAIVETVQ